MAVGSYFQHRRKGLLAQLQWALIKFLKLGYKGWLRFFWWELSKRFRKSITTISTKQGVFTISSADEVISRSLYCRGEYELEFTSQALKLLREIQQCPPKGQGTVVDIGANNGVISIGILYTGEMERAIAIEPEPQNFSLLQRNVDQNGLEKRFICLPYALSDKHGQVVLELSGSDFGDHRVRPTSQVRDSPELFHESTRSVIGVQSEQLDRLLVDLPEDFTRTIAVIWADVQGYEGHVFAGAKELLSRGIPVVSEIWPYALKRSGMTLEQYCLNARNYWTSYWLMVGSEFVRYPIDTLDQFLAELADYEQPNVVFTQ